MGRSGLATSWRDGSETGAVVMTAVCASDKRGLVYGHFPTLVAFKDLWFGGTPQTGAVLADIRALRRDFSSTNLHKLTSISICAGAYLQNLDHMVDISTWYTIQLN